MALCLRIPIQLPLKLKYQFQCCRYLTRTRIQSMKKEAHKTLLELRLPCKGIRAESCSTKASKTGQDVKFYELGQELIGPYLNLLKGLTQDIPEPPPNWDLKCGWTRYTPSGSVPVDFPEEAALVFDVEVCVQEGFYPTLAAAVSQEAWYLWVSPRLIERNETLPSTLTRSDLIPLGNSAHPRVVVGHFISYDRARIRESYSLIDSGLRYFDTMSAHTCVNGVTNIQRNLMFSSAHNNDEWRQLTSPNSLEKISEFYCGITVNKTNRNVFVTGTLEEISKDFQSLSRYCVEDVIATHKVFCKLLPLFLDRQPHPLTLAGMLELSTPIMPVKKSWVDTLEKVKSIACELTEQQYRLMKKRADECLALMENQRYTLDPWMWDQDWKPQRWKANYYPSWYKAFCTGLAKSFDESNGTSVVYGGLVVPKILRLRCGPYPLHHINRLGWGVIVPVEDFIGNINTYLEDDIPPIPTTQIIEVCNTPVESLSPSKTPPLSSIMEWIESDLYWRESSSTSSSLGSTEPQESPSVDTIHELLINDRFVFRRFLNVGGLRPVRNPLGITMSKSLTSLNSLEQHGETFLKIRDELSPWLSHGSRWKTQSVVFMDKSSERESSADESFDEDFGIILPMVEVCADYLRLPRERAWSSLLSLNSNQLGADLANCVQAPCGRSFLVATIPDLDLSLAAVLSDVVNKPAFRTTFSGLFYNGTLFTEMARALKTSPEEAKWLCHGVIAGADTYVLSKLIYQAHVNISKDEAFQRACRCMDLLLDYKLLSASPSDLWPNIDADELRTPILGARLSRPLQVEKNRVRLRAQWMIHSSKADFLHALVAVFRKEEPNIRLCFVRGDNMSLYFLVKNSRMDTAQERLARTFRDVGSFCAHRLGVGKRYMRRSLRLRMFVSKSLK